MKTVRMSNRHGQGAQVPVEIFEKATSGGFALRAVHENLIANSSFGSCWNGGMSLVLIRDDDQMTLGEKSVMLADGSVVKADCYSYRVSEGFGRTRLETIQPERHPKDIMEMPVWKVSNPGNNTPRIGFL